MTTKLQTEIGSCRKQFSSKCPFLHYCINNKIDFNWIPILLLSVWITKVWRMSRDFPSSIKKTLKILSRLYTVGPLKHVRWVMGLPMA